MDADPASPHAPDPARPLPDDAEIFEAAIEAVRADPAGLGPFLAAACGGDHAREARIGDLVRRCLERRGGGAFATPLPERIPELAAAFAADNAFDDDPADEGDDDLVGTAIGPIVLVRRIGAGSFGVVYEGHEDWPARLVAVKVMRSDVASRELVRRFEFEADLLACLDHPGIARIIRAGTLERDGRKLPYLVMDHVADARSITAHAAAAGLTLRRRLELFHLVATAVGAAHSRGVIHRDLKPANLLVGADGLPRVIDFGWGRAIGLPASPRHQATMAGRVIGTIQYMSPEQLRGDPQAVDTRGDVYSLGVILHELLAGRPPYDVRDQGLFAAAATVENAVPPPLHRLDRRVPREVSTIVATCLQKDPMKRYSSALELAADLGRHLAGEPIHASPPRAIDSLRRFARRHTLAAAALAVAFVSLAAAVVGVAAFALRSERARQVAVDARRAEREALALAEARLGIANRETATARRELYVANLYRLADLVDGPSVAAAMDSFDDTLRDIGIEPARRRGSDVPGVPLEMRCLWPAIDQSLLSMGGWLDGRPSRVAWSPDGRFIAAAGSAGKAYAVALATARNAHRLESGAAAVNDVAFSPDSARLATVSADGIHVWDTASKQLVFTAAVPAARWERVAFRPDGRQIAAAASDGSLVIVDVATGQTVATPARHAASIVTLAYSPDGTRLLTASADASVRIWNADTGTRLHRLVTKRLKPFRCGAFSPDGAYAAAGDAGGGVRIWEVESGKPVHDIHETDALIHALAFSPDGALLAVGDDRGIAAIHDIRHPEAEPIRLEGHGRLLSSLAWSRDGRRLVAASYDRNRMIRVWNVADGSVVRLIRGHAGAISSIAVSPDGTWLASTGNDNTLRLWDAADRPTTVLAAADPIVVATLSADGTAIVCGTAAGELVLFDSRSLERRAAVMAHAGAVAALAVSADGGMLVSGGADGRVRAHALPGLAPHGDLAEHPGGVRALVVLADGRCVSAGADGVARVADVRTGASLVATAAGAGAVRALAVAPPVPEAGGATGPAGVIALAFGNGGVTTYSLASGERLADVVNAAVKVSNLAVSPDGRLLATGGERTGLVTLVDLRSNVTLGSRAGHKGTVTELGFSADGRHLLSAAEDNHVRVWPVPDGEPIADHGGLEVPVLTAAESPRGDRLATGSADGTVRLWDRSKGDQLVVL
ncbi:MAG: serine/threonine protein kinase, partial [Planctomycetes bacterium]|nr:serine/threonine protein kinase [Planctomycetota bacterium]